MDDKTTYRTIVKTTIIQGIPIAAIILAAVFLIVRIIFFFFADFAWYEKVLAFFLLLAEVFVLIHGIGYILEILSVVRHRKDIEKKEEAVPPLKTYPAVAVIVSSYKEPIDVVRNTLITFYNLTYPNKYIYFLDDTRYDLPWDTPEKMEAYKAEVEKMCQDIGVDLFRRKWHGAKAGMINDFLEFIDGRQKEGFEFFNFSGKKKIEKEKYIVVFDADMNPFPDFIEPLVAIMESNDGLAFVQTPQYYTNFMYNRISRATLFQQMVFYEYICEGKSTKGATFCCGTNVIFRRKALMDVGGFDETSVTEDFATSLKFHLKGWQSRYLNKVGAFGMGPEDLGGFFKQQFRWSLGTIGMFPKVLSFFTKNYNRLRLVQWWEYLLSSTWYFIGFVFFIMVLCPILYIFLGVPTYFQQPIIYIMLFVPYIVMTLITFYWTLMRRNYRLSDLLTGQLLTYITFPVYIKSSVLALLGKRGQFGITPKGGSRSLPLRSLWIQLLLAAVCFSGLIWGINRLIYEREPFGGIFVNTIWCLYHFIILSSVLYFNSAVETEQKVRR